MSRSGHTDTKALAKTGPTKVAAPKATTPKPSVATTLITGATGFLGAHLLRVLAAKDEGGAGAKPARLRVLTQAASAPQWLTDLGVEVVSGSVTDAGAVERAVVGVDRIYHLAGLVSSKPGDAHRMHAVHVHGTRCLCEAAAHAGVTRVVMSSTSGTVAVSRRSDEMPDETSPTPMDIVARWPYYASKVYQEEAARRACGDRVELVMVNPSLLLGPGDDRLSSTRPVLQFLAREIAMVPPGGLNFVDVRDVAALLPAAMERGTAGERYLVGGYNWTFAEFLGRLERLTKVPGPMLKARGKLPLLATRAQAAMYRHWGRTPPLEPQSVEMAEYFWYFDSGKAARELGFIPRDATDTLFDTVTYIRANFLGNGALSKQAG
jgi:dihydroflavonol-4-reductase